VEKTLAPGTLILPSRRVGRAGVVAFRWRSGVRSMLRVGDLVSPWVVGVEEFTGVAGVELPVEMCEESEVSELSPLERSGVAQKRLRFVLFEFLWCGGAIGQGDQISAR
jgi:hypothetical protein